MKNNNVEVKVTIGNVTKATFVVVLGVRFGIYMADAAYKAVIGGSELVAKYLVKKMENAELIKKVKTDFDAEFDSAVEKMNEEMKKEGESES